MLRLIKPFVFPAVAGVLLLGVAQFYVDEPLYRSVLYGAGVALVGVAFWVVTAMVTGWNVSGGR